MIPGMVYLIPYFASFSKLGLLDTRFGLIIAHSVFTLPLVVWMLIPFFDEIPKDLDEAAKIDGASVFRTFWNVVLPLSSPGLASTAILSFIFSWNEFVFAVVLTRKKAITAPVAIAQFMGYQGEGYGWGKIAAGGIMVLIPVILFSIIVRKYLVKGLLGGAVKY